MSVPSTAEFTRARMSRRAVALVLVVAGVVACTMSVLDVTGGALGEARFLLTVGFLLLGPGWAVAGFLRRAPAAHVWLLAIGVGVATTLIAAQLMVSTGAWQPGAVLYIITVISAPFLLRHAVVAQ